MGFDASAAATSLASVRRALGQDDSLPVADGQARDIEEGDDDEADMEDLAARKDDFYADALEDARVRLVHWTWAIWRCHARRTSRRSPPRRGPPSPSG